MNAPFRSLVLLACLTLCRVGSVGAQGTDKETAAAIQKANEAAKEMGMDLPDVKALLDEAEQDGGKAKPAGKMPALPDGGVMDAPKEKTKAKANGPMLFPDWTPATPQFKPDGPISRKMIDGRELVAQTGTSPLTPAELGDIWFAVSPEKFNRGRNNNSINGDLTVIIYLTERAAPQRKIRLTAERPQVAKITKVTIYVEPAKDEDDDDD